MTEGQFQREFEEHVSSEDYLLILKALEDHKPRFSEDLFEIFKRAIKKGGKLMLTSVLKIFETKPKTAEEIRERIKKSIKILTPGVAEYLLEVTQP